jgi:hypothetical protein
MIMKEGKLFKITSRGSELLSNGLLRVDPER